MRIRFDPNNAIDSFLDTVECLGSLSTVRLTVTVEDGENIVDERNSVDNLKNVKNLEERHAPEGELSEDRDVQNTRGQSETERFIKLDVQEHPPVSNYEPSSTKEKIQTDKKLLNPDDALSLLSSIKELEQAIGNMGIALHFDNHQQSNDDINLDTKSDTEKQSSTLPLSYGVYSSSNIKSFRPPDRENNQNLHVPRERGRAKQKSLLPARSGKPTENDNQSSYAEIDGVDSFLGYHHNPPKVTDKVALANEMWFGKYRDAFDARDYRRARSASPNTFASRTNSRKLLENEEVNTIKSRTKGKSNIRDKRKRNVTIACSVISGDKETQKNNLTDKIVFKQNDTNTKEDRNTTNGKCEQTVFSEDKNVTLNIRKSEEKTMEPADSSFANSRSKQKHNKPATAREKRNRNRTITCDISDAIAEARKLDGNTYAINVSQEFLEENKSEADSMKMEEEMIDVLTPGLDKRRRNKTISGDIREMVKEARKRLEIDENVQCDDSIPKDMLTSASKPADSSWNFSQNSFSSSYKSDGKGLRGSLHYPQLNLENFGKFQTTNQLNKENDSDNSGKEFKSSNLKSEQRPQIGSNSKFRIPSFEEMLYNKEK